MANRILIATSNPGKLRNFSVIAAQRGVDIASLPDFDQLPPVEENGTTFESNARKKAEFYSLHAHGELVLADDSGLEVSALNGAPGVRSARYAADELSRAAPSMNVSIDYANNSRLLRELHKVDDDLRTARFVCVLAAARDGKILAVFDGEVQGVITRSPRGQNGFGYDPLFLISDFGKTLAELSDEEKAVISHRGQAFRKFLKWRETLVNLVIG